MADLAVRDSVVTAQQAEKQDTVAVSNPNEKKAVPIASQAEDEVKMYNEAKQQALAEIDMKIEELKATIAEKERNSISKTLNKALAGCCGISLGLYSSDILMNLINKKAISNSSIGIFGASALTTLLLFLDAKNVDKMKKELNELQNRREAIKYFGTAVA